MALAGATTIITAGTVGTDSAQPDSADVRRVIQVSRAEVGIGQIGRVEVGIGQIGII